MGLLVYYGQISTPCPLAVAALTGRSISQSRHLLVYILGPRVEGATICLPQYISNKVRIPLLKSFWCGLREMHLRTIPVAVKYLRSIENSVMSSHTVCNDARSVKATTVIKNN